MKLALLTDTHFGCREGKEIFHSFFEKFYSECFFPTLEERGIKHVLHLGDLMDRRKYVDYYSLKRSKEYFFDPLQKADIEMDVIIGNHDIALRNTLDINSPDLLLKQYYNINPITKPSELSFEGTKFLMLPWVCADNYADSMNAIKTTDADVVCAHAEIQGFAMYRGVESHEGFDSGIFKKFDKVFSGHYHHRSNKGNITYLGNPYELTHMDYADTRGFHIFDTVTRKLEFIRNPFTMFDRFVYDDTQTDPASIDTKTFANKFVKIVVQKKTDFYKFDQFMDRVYNSGAHDIKVMETLNELAAEELDEAVNIEDTQAILAHYVENADVDVDKAELSKYIGTLYTEALHLDR
jgi:DNA repair exonuclease SbcCD nuclease subunit